MNTEDFDPDKLTQAQILKLKQALPCSRDAITIADHEKRLKFLEDLNTKLGILILGNEGQPSIFKQLSDISARLKVVEDFLKVNARDLKDLEQTVSQSKFQKLFNSASWKIILLFLGAAAGIILKHFWLMGLK